MKCSEKYAVIEVYSGSLVDLFNTFQEAFECLQEIRSEGGCYAIFERMSNNKIKDLMD